MLKFQKLNFSSHKRAIRMQFQQIEHPMLSTEIGKDIGVKKSKRGDAHIKLMP